MANGKKLSEKEQGVLRSAYRRGHAEKPLQKYFRGLSSRRYKRPSEYSHWLKLKSQDKVTGFD